MQEYYKSFSPALSSEAHCNCHTLDSHSNRNLLHPSVIHTPAWFAAHYKQHDEEHPRSLHEVTIRKKHLSHRCGICMSGQALWSRQGSVVSLMGASIVTMRSASKLRDMDTGLWLEELASPYWQLVR